MGGNALGTRRIDATEYQHIKALVEQQLAARLTDRRFEVTKSYRNKQSFGDLDVLIETNENDVAWDVFIRQVFNPKKIVNNMYVEPPKENIDQRYMTDNVWSFDVHDFQVDFILTPKEHFQSSADYYAWNDMGNLIGRIYKKMGFKYGITGLTYTFRRDDNAFSAYAEEIISKDTRAIFEFGGLDYDRWMQGFDDLEDAFLWLAQSKYFHPDMYLLENRNHKSRVRDAKRTNYRLFLYWCGQNDGICTHRPWPEMREQFGYNGYPEFLHKALRFFPGFMELHCRTLFLEEQRRRVKDKFNGRIVNSITGLKGKELGAFMDYIEMREGGRSVLWPKIFHCTEPFVEELVRRHYDEYAKGTT